MNYLFFSHVAQGNAETVLLRLSRCLASIQAMNRSMTVEVANVFLMVALDEGQRSTDYAKKTGLAQSTISRYLLDLSTYRRDLSEEADEGRKEAYGLVRSEVDPMELRAKRYYLTPKGRGLRDRFVAILEGTAPVTPVRYVIAKKA